MYVCKETYCSNIASCCKMLILFNLPQDIRNVIWTKIVHLQIFGFVYIISSIKNRKNNNTFLNHYILLPCMMFYYLVTIVIY